ncbi:hypothetical protein K1719_006364 [Acacia pycnantha]|nr:hypothetical protein K1719_006364 [Acacia pycnantha]
MRVRGYFPDEVTMSTVVKVLKDAGEFDIAEKFYKSWCDGRVEIDIADLGDSLTGSEVGHCRTGRDVAEYNVMIKAYGTSKLYDKAIALFKGMRNQGTWPDECTYNSIIQMLSGADLVDQARELLTEMMGMKIKPSCQTFSAVIGCYAHLECGSLEEAHEYFQKMEESGIAANLIVLTSLLKAYCKIGSLEDAKTIYERMKDLEGGLDRVACNSMIGFFADNGMVSEAKLVFEHLREKGWADGVSYAMMMCLYRNMGMLDDAIEIAEEMKPLGLLKDCVSYNQNLLKHSLNLGPLLILLPIMWPSIVMVQERRMLNKEECSETETEDEDESDEASLGP